MAQGPTPLNIPTAANDTADHTLGERICKARDAAALSTAQLARRLGIKTSTLQAWESDRSEPRSNKLVLLAGILNVSPSWLLIGRGEAPSETAQETLDMDGLRLALDDLQKQAQSVADEIDRLKERLEA